MARTRNAGDKEKGFQKLNGQKVKANLRGSLRCAVLSLSSSSGTGGRKSAPSPHPARPTNRGAEQGRSRQIQIWPESNLCKEVA